MLNLTKIKSEMLLNIVSQHLLETKRPMFIKDACKIYSQVFQENQYEDNPGMFSKYIKAMAYKYFRKVDNKDAEYLICYGLITSDNYAVFYKEDRCDTPEIVRIEDEHISKCITIVCHHDNKILHMSIEGDKLYMNWGISKFEITEPYTQWYTKCQFSINLFNECAKKTSNLGRQQLYYMTYMIQEFAKSKMSLKQLTKKLVEFGSLLYQAICKAPKNELSTYQLMSKTTYAKPYLQSENDLVAFCYSKNLINISSFNEHCVKKFIVLSQVNTIIQPMVQMILKRCSGYYNRPYHLIYELIGKVWKIEAIELRMLIELIVRQNTHLFTDEIISPTEAVRAIYHRMILKPIPVANQYDLTRIYIIHILSALKKVN